MMIHQICRVCYHGFETNNPAHIRCSDACRQKEKSERNYIRFHKQYIPEPNSGCWLWLGDVRRSGLPYGEFKMNGRTRSAHQVSFELFKGPRNPSLFVLHSCDNPYCVNPDHLSQGTIEENQSQMVARGRSLFGEKNYRAKITERDVIAIRSGDHGQRGYRERMAEKYNLDPSTIGDILTKKIWKHIR